MHVLMFGATERIGRAAVEYALGAGHQVTVLLPPKATFDVHHLHLTRVEGDIARSDSLVIPMMSEVDAIVNAIGSDISAAKAGHVTGAARIILAAMGRYGVKRYLGVTACTALRALNWWGGLTQQVFRLSPTRAALQDHDRAAALVRGSKLEWTLAAVPAVRTGARTGEYRVSAEGFPGGWRRISVQDVADFLVRELVRKRYPNQAVGVWY